MTKTQREPLEVRLRKAMEQKQSDLTGIVGVGETVSWCTVSGLTLRRADLRSTTYLTTHFVHCDLRDADLRDARLANAEWVRSDLRGADLRNVAGQASSKLVTCDLRGAQMDDFDLNTVALWECRLDVGALAAARTVSVATSVKGWLAQMSPAAVRYLRTELVAGRLDGQHCPDRVKKERFVDRILEDDAESELGSARFTNEADDDDGDAPIFYRETVIIQGKPFLLPVAVDSLGAVVKPSGFHQTLARFYGVGTAAAQYPASYTPYSALSALESHIRPRHTPKNNEMARLLARWIDEFLAG